MLTALDAAAALTRSRRAGLDDPTEFVGPPVRWYWNRATGELNRAYWRDPCPVAYPHLRQPSEVLQP